MGYPRTALSRIATIAITTALAALSGACASTGATPYPFPMPGPRAKPAPATADAPSDPIETPTTPAAPDRPRAPRGVDDYALVETALDLRGIPYRNGGVDRSGFDCSGFTQFVFAQHGLALPREVRDQYRLGKPVTARELEPGDLIFFETTAAGPSHVGIAVGGDEFVHAPSSTGVVRVERLSASYWASRLVGARRVLAN